MKTLSLILSTGWMVVRHAPTALYHVPAVIALIRKMVAAFGSDKVQEAIKAFSALLDKLTPPSPTTDSTGTSPTNLKREQRRRLFRFRNRLDVAGMITDDEVQEFCHQHHISNSRDYQHA